MSDTPRNLRIAPHARGQTAIFDDVGLVCTMEAGSQSKRDTDAAYIVGLELENRRFKDALETICAAVNTDTPRRFP